MGANLRFWNKVARMASGCWEWQGGISNGYGSFFLDGKKVKAHRYAYESMGNVIPARLEIDHLCRNRGCVNPAHMEPVTRAENIRRGLFPEIGRQYQLSKTHCPQGHLYDEENTYLRIDKVGRECRTCRKAAKRRFINARS